MVKTLSYVLAGASFLVKGIAIQQLWGWFIAPYFGLTGISFNLALGFGCFAEVVGLTHELDLRMNDAEKLEHRFVYDIGIPLTGLLVGYILKGGFQ